MNRAEHLQWAKDRALEYVGLGDLMEAFQSMLSDLSKHPELENAAAVCGELGMKLLLNGHLSTAEQMRDWINGVN